MRSLNGDSLEGIFIEYSSYREVVWIAHDTSILISSMILRVETTPKSSSIGGISVWSPQRIFNVPPIQITNERKILC